MVRQAARFAKIAWARPVERIEQLLTLNQRVQGSNPCTPTNKIKYITAEWGFPLSF